MIGDVESDDLDESIQEVAPLPRPTTGTEHVLYGLSVAWGITHITLTLLATIEENPSDSLRQYESIWKFYNDRYPDGGMLILSMLVWMLEATGPLLFSTAPRWLPEVREALACRSNPESKSIITQLSEMKREDKLKLCAYTTSTLAAATYTTLALMPQTKEQFAPFLVESDSVMFSIVVCGFTISSIATVPFWVPYFLKKATATGRALYNNMPRIYKKSSLTALAYMALMTAIPQTRTQLTTSTAISGHFAIISAIIATPKLYQLPLSDKMFTLTALTYIALTTLIPETSSQLTSMGIITHLAAAGAIATLPRWVSGVVSEIYRIPRPYKISLSLAVTHAIIGAQIYNTPGSYLNDILQDDYYLGQIAEFALLSATPTLLKKMAPTVYNMIAARCGPPCDAVVERFEQIASPIYNAIANSNALGGPTQDYRQNYPFLPTDAKEFNPEMLGFAIHLYRNPDKIPFAIKYFTSPVKHPLKIGQLDHNAFLEMVATSKDFEHLCQQFNRGNLKNIATYVSKLTAGATGWQGARLPYGDYAMSQLPGLSVATGTGASVALSAVNSTAEKLQGKTAAQAYLITGTSLLPTVILVNALWEPVWTPIADYFESEYGMNPQLSRSIGYFLVSTLFIVTQVGWAQALDKMLPSWEAHTWKPSLSYILLLTACYMGFGAIPEALSLPAAGLASLGSAALGVFLPALIHGAVEYPVLKHAAEKTLSAEFLEYKDNDSEDILFNVEGQVYQALSGGDSTPAPRPNLCKTVSDALGCCLSWISSPCLPGRRGANNPAPQQQRLLSLQSPQAERQGFGSFT